MKTLACLMYFAGAAALAFAQQTTTSASALSSADLAAIRTLNDRYRQTTLDHAWSQWAALFTTDGILMPPNGAAITGRADIEAWGRSFPPVTGFENPIAEIEGSGNLAVTRGSFTLVLAPPNQPEQQDRGKWICTLRKQPDGTWKFHRCIFNSDLPLPAGSSSGSMTATDPWMDGTWEARQSPRADRMAGNVIGAGAVAMNTSRRHPLSVFLGIDSILWNNANGRTLPCWA